MPINVEIAVEMSEGRITSDGETEPNAARSVTTDTGRSCIEVALTTNSILLAYSLSAASIRLIASSPDLVAIAPMPTRFAAMQVESGASALPVSPKMPLSGFFKARASPTVSPESSKTRKNPSQTAYTAASLRASETALEAPASSAETRLSGFDMPQRAIEAAIHTIKIIFTA